MCRATVAPDAVIPLAALPHPPEMDTNTPAHLSGNRSRVTEGERYVRRKFGNLVRDMRTEAGLTQQQVADAMGMERSSVSNIEAGRQGAISLDTLFSVADVFKVDPGRLFRRLTGDDGDDWTAGPDGRANDSRLFRSLAEEVTQLIRNSAHDLIAGRANTVGYLIVAQLAHKHGLRPVGSEGARGDV